MDDANKIKITQTLASWQFQNNVVERQMDSAAYEAAHPDDTLVLAGPPRLGSVQAEAALNAPGSLLAIGMVQAFSLSSTKPTQPMMALGSSRSFFVSGKSQTQWTIARLFINSRNLLRVLSHNYVVGGGNADKFDDPAANEATSQFFINLDSELFYIPFGLGCMFRNKTHQLLGAFYVELAMINSYSLGFTAGQNMVLENVTGLCDRVLPWGITAGTAAANGGLDPTVMQAVLGFMDPTTDAGAVKDETPGS